MLDPVGPGSVLATAEVVMTEVDDTLREVLDAAMRFVKERIRSVATPNERAHIQSDLRFLLSVQLLPSVLAVACHAFRREPGWAEVMNGPVVALVEGLGESPLPADSSFLEEVSRAVDPHH